MRKHLFLIVSIVFALKGLVKPTLFETTNN